ncbi:MAG: hypothetical protein M1836_002955 [Candelina mexicana]|nr:MAG: hypothetical protein M1836_002955 [Candelina mexicana]
MDRDRSRRFDERDRRGDYRDDYRGGQRSRRPSPPRAGDSYVPANNTRGAGRRRSRSPELRRRRSRSPLPREVDVGDSWRGRPRSPRRWEPRDEIRRDIRTRTPPPERMIRPRSPFEPSRRPPPYSGRERSPLPMKRGRDLSPTGDRGRRSPLPEKKREKRISPGFDRSGRPASPPDDRQYRPVRNGRDSPPRGPTGSLYTPSHSPVRQGRRHEREDTGPQTRRRSLSPLPRLNQSGLSSGKESASTSRRSSPPIHPSRLALQQPSGFDARLPSSSLTGTVPRAPTIPTYEFSGANRRMSPPVDRIRSPTYRARSDRVGSPPRYSRAYRSPPRRSPSPMSSIDHRQNGLKKVSSSSIQLSKPVGQAIRSKDNAASRAPPSGPAGGPRANESSKAMSPPSGPASVPLSMSAHNRPINSASSAPIRPRGGYGSHSFGRESSREGSYSGTPPAGPRRAPSSSLHYHSTNSVRGPPPSSSNLSPAPLASGGVPTGPRSSHSSGPPSHAHSTPFRSSHNSSSTTYPRTQRFAVLASVPQIVPGGKLLPSGIDPKIAERLAKLDEEKKKLEAEVARMEEQSRSGLREWDRLSRDSNRESFKSELAEQHVSMLAGESGMGGAAF